jgi:type III secretion protein S
LDPIALHYASKALFLVLILSLPPILVASLVGLGLSLFQAITQLQEQTLSFGIKLIAVSITIFACSGWVAVELISFSSEIFNRFWLV